MSHEELANQNRRAWEAQSYAAWVSAYGTPTSAAAELVRDPNHKLRRLLPYLPNLEGKRIANPLGSHGRIAVSLALLGADVTVFDISAPNKRYATELAEAAGVKIEYAVGDFLKLAAAEQQRYDQVVMELGVLHYFNDLDRFVQALTHILQAGGMVILNEFHPLLKKVIDIGDKKDVGITLSGDYFSSAVETADAPYSVFLNDEVVPTCLIRRWNLGEIVTAFSENGFRLNKLVEEPSSENPKLPGTFTLVATAD